FSVGARVKAGTGPAATALRDMNGDGIADLVVSNSVSNDVSIIPGAGGGFFRDQAAQTIPAGISPGPVFLGNFTGQPGFVTATAGSNAVSLTRGVGGPALAITRVGSGGITPVTAVEFTDPASGLNGLIVANNGDGVLSLLEGGPGG